MRITIAGVGYVGLSLAVLLSQHNRVTAITTTPSKAELINNKKSPIRDIEIEDYLATKTLNLTATTDKENAYSDADIIIIATPTNYDDEQNFFDTSCVEDAISCALRVNTSALIVIKSTIPVGYTENIRKKFKYNEIIFSPEFLREGKALFDNLHPSRIVVGAFPEQYEKAKIFADLLQGSAAERNCPVLFCPPTEAEAIKLFANTYLAVRIAYFNELDTYAQIKGLDTKAIIDGICLDPRIGAHYNNPSFGYGGYCLPKDTRQLLANFQNVPQNMIEAVVKANKTRKEFIAAQIMAMKPSCVGVYRLTMKTDSDNFRSSAIQDIIQTLTFNGIMVVIYEPALKESCFNGCKKIESLKEFKQISDVIVANRNATELSDVREKLFTRDIYSKD